MPSTAKRNSPERTTLPPVADPDEIRLLCLLPGVFGERIICTTTHVKLSENFQTKPPASLPLCNRSVDVHRPETAHHRPQYEALSYVWGPTEMKSISLDSQSCDVRENLFDALVNLRSENQQRTLWVDAICIYVYRHGKKPFKNLRFGPPVSEGFLFPNRISKPLFIRLRNVLLILCLDPCILTLK